MFSVCLARAGNGMFTLVGNLGGTIAITGTYDNGKKGNVPFGSH